MQRNRSLSSLQAAPAPPPRGALPAHRQWGDGAAREASRVSGTFRAGDCLPGVTVLLRGPWAAQTLRGVVCYRGGPVKWRLLPCEGSGRIVGSGVAEDADAHSGWRTSLWRVAACEVSPSPDLIPADERFLIPAVRQDLCWELRRGSAQTDRQTDPALARLGSGAE